MNCHLIFFPTGSLKDVRFNLIYSADIIVEIGGILSKFFDKSDWQQSR